MQKRLMGWMLTILGIVCLYLSIQELLRPALGSVDMREVITWGLLSACSLFGGLSLLNSRSTTGRRTNDPYHHAH